MTEIVRGLNFRRTEDNPDELVMVKGWEKFLLTGRSAGRPDAIDYILYPGPNPKICSLRDRMVAATIIQWLGSPVGSAFAREALDKIELERQRRLKTEMAKNYMSPLGRNNGRQKP